MNQSTHQTPQLVDARLAGGTVTVDLNDDPELFTGYVRLEVPGLRPILLQTHEAYALAAALDTAANAAEEVESAR